MVRKILTISPLLFFLLVQCYSAFFMWYNHPGPLGLDDAGWYISPITFFKENLLFFLNGQQIPDEPCFNINKLLHPYIFGLLASISGISAEQMFEYNFYIGMILMGIVLYNLFKKIDDSTQFLATAFLLFAFYAGNGYYHGFFWVVPSFYAILLFLTLIITLFYSHHRYLYSIPVILLLLLTHSTGLYLALLVLTAFFIHETFFRKNRASLKEFALLLLLTTVIFAVGEYLYHLNVIHFSFTSSLLAYSNKAGIINPENVLSFSERFEIILNEILDTITRYQFTKYFYGIFTPLLIYSIYRLAKNGHSILLTLFVLAFTGQIVMSPLTEHSYRFFYPLEILTWIMLAYGISQLLQAMFNKKPKECTDNTSTSLKVLQWLLLGLSLLFFYDAIHLKADRDYSFKFYHPRFFDKEEFQNYLGRHPDSNVIIFTDLRDYYKSIEGIRQNANIRFSWQASPSDITAAPERTIIIGENRKYYSEKRKGFSSIIFPYGSLILKQLTLKPGNYRLELLDSGIGNIGALQLLSGKKPLSSSWQKELSMINVPEENMYPAVLMPWHWFAKHNWPLYSRPHHNGGAVRETENFRLEITIDEPTSELRLYNITNTPVYIYGMIRITSLEHAKNAWTVDLDWGTAKDLNKKAALILNDSVHPLLWVAQEEGSGYNDMLFKLEHSFKDVKAFRLYAENPDDLQTSEPEAADEN